MGRGNTGQAAWGRRYGAGNTEAGDGSLGSGNMEVCNMDADNIEATKPVVNRPLWIIGCHAALQSVP
jgi:hypothetical protein